MDAQAAFAEILENLPRQHLRTRFRSRFGTPEADFGEGTFVRGSVRAGLDRRLGNLLQEEPDSLRAVQLAGPADDLGIDRTSPSAADSLGSVLSEGRVLLIHGSTARLYAYLAPGEEEAWVRRVPVPKEERPSAAPKAPALSRRKRAALAGKTKPVRKSPPRRRG